MIYLILILGILILVLYYYFVKVHTLWKRKGVQQPTLWQIVGDSLKAIVGLESFVDTMKKVYHRFPDARYYGIYQFTAPLLLIRDPDLIKEITVKSFDHFTDHRNLGSSDDDPFWSKNLFSLRGEKWKQMRNTVSPTFTGSKMRIMFHLMDQVSKRYVDYYLNPSSTEETIELEIKDSVTRLANDIIATCAFGLECNSMQDQTNDFYLNARAAANISSFISNIKIIISLNLPKLAGLLKVDVMSPDVIKFYKNVVMKSIKMREEQRISRPDVIDLLMQTRKNLRKPENSDDFDEISNHKDNQHLENDNKTIELSDDDIVAQVIVFMIGGFDTIANVIAFSLYELALNPDIQKKLQKEVDDVLNECKGDLSYDQLMKMQYLDMVVSESLRKWPPGLQLDRICTKPFTIESKNATECDVHLQEGDVVLFNIYSLHHDAKYFPDPERFDPERFNEDNKRFVNPYIYMPFGSGPRSCVAIRFALMEIKTTLFRILSRLDVIVVRKTAIPVKLITSQLVIVPDGGIWLGYRKRSI